MDEINERERARIRIPTNQLLSAKAKPEEKINLEVVSPEPFWVWGRAAPLNSDQKLDVKMSIGATLIFRTELRVSIHDGNLGESREMVVVFSPKSLVFLTFGLPLR